ncbi:MAG: hypothetical protein AAB366_00760 [Patescibacteria group bacterium]
MIEKTDNKIVKFPIEITEKEYDALISISGGDVEKMATDYLREVAAGAAGKKKIKSFKKNCPFCDRTITIYTDGRRILLNSTRPDLA